MHFEKRKTNDRWLITPEAGENIEDILLAITRASFESAESAGMGLLHYDPGDKWEDVKTQVTLCPGGKNSPMLLHLDYIAGRRCKSQVWRRGSKLFFHAGLEREPDAKLILTMANDFLHGRQKILPLKPPGIWE